MMAGHDSVREGDLFPSPDMDALSIASERIHRQLQLRRMRLQAAGATTRGDQRQQQTWLKLREQTSTPADPVRWLRFQSSGNGSLPGRVDDQD